MAVQQGSSVEISFFNSISQLRERALAEVLSVEPLRVKVYGTTLILSAIYDEVHIEKVLPKKPSWA